MTYKAAISIGREASYGAGGTTNREYAVVDEGLDWSDPDVDGEGFYSGQEGPLDTAVCRPVLGGAGPITIQPTSKGLGLLLEECIGTGVSTLVSTGIYQQVFTWADTLKSAVIQKQIPRRDGSIGVQLHKGCVVTSFELSMDPKGIASLAINYDLRDPSGTAAADALTSIKGARFCFAVLKVQSGTITAPGATTLGSGTTNLTGVRSVKVTVDHKLDTDNPYHANGAGLKDMPLPSELRTIEVELVREYVDEAMETAWRGATTTGLVITLEAESLGASNACINITLPALRPKGPLPKIGKESVITTPYKLVAYKTAAFSQRMYLVTRTSDAALA